MPIIIQLNLDGPNFISVPLPLGWLSAGKEVLVGWIPSPWGWDLLHPKKTQPAPQPQGCNIPSKFHCFLSIGGGLLSTFKKPIKINFPPKAF